MFKFEISLQSRRADQMKDAERTQRRIHHCLQNARWPARIPATPALFPGHDNRNQKVIDDACKACWRGDYKRLQEIMRDPRYDPNAACSDMTEDTHQSKTGFCLSEVAPMVACIFGDESIPEHSECNFDKNYDAVLQLLLDDRRLMTESFATAISACYWSSNSTLLQAMVQNKRMRTGLATLAFLEAMVAFADNHTVAWNDCHRVGLACPFVMDIAIRNRSALAILDVVSKSNNPDQGHTRMSGARPNATETQKRRFWNVLVDTQRAWTEFALVSLLPLPPVRNHNNSPTHAKTKMSDQNKKIKRDCIRPTSSHECNQNLGTPV